MKRREDTMDEDVSSADTELVPGEKKIRKRRIRVEQLSFLPPLAAGFFRLLFGSCHYTIIGREHEEEALRWNGPKLFTCWHFAYPAVIHHFRDNKAMIMVSRSRDGEWAARILQNLGYECFRGSPGKGGGEALRQIITHLKSGPGGGLVADGSQGPALIVQRGILLLAQYSGSPLVPVSMAASPCRRMRSWDKTVVPQPFSHVTLAFGPIIRVPRDVTREELERLRLELQNSLNVLTEQAERSLAQEGERD